jgi:hypothetical protein
VVRARVDADDVRIRCVERLTDLPETSTGDVERAHDAALGGDVEPVEPVVEREHVGFEADPRARGASGSQVDAHEFGVDLARHVCGPSGAVDGKAVRVQAAGDGVRADDGVRSGIDLRDRVARLDGDEHVSARPIVDGVPRFPAEVDACDDPVRACVDHDVFAAGFVGDEDVLRARIVGETIDVAGTDTANDLHRARVDRDDFARALGRSIDPVALADGQDAADRRGSGNRRDDAAALRVDRDHGVCAEVGDVQQPAQWVEALVIESRGVAGERDIGERPQWERRAAHEGIRAGRQPGERADQDDQKTPPDTNVSNHWSTLSRFLDELRIYRYIKRNNSYNILGGQALDWVFLVSSISGQNGALRIRTWRALKALGVGSLRDGVYVLPDRPEFREAFAAQQRDIAASGGTAYVLVAAGRTESEDAALRVLFDRGESYTAFTADAEAFAATVGDGVESEARRRLRQLARDHAAIEAIDFFESPGRDRARAVLASLQNAVLKAYSPDEPAAVVAPIERRERSAFRRRVWATRQRMWVDRVACAWLIRRFIDPEPTFAWLADVRDCPPDAVGFDFDGATFTHVADLTTFEVLLATFDLDRDVSLGKIAGIVHSLDVGGPAVPEGAGFETLLGGARERSTGDDELLERMSDVLDSLYEAFRS